MADSAARHVRLSAVGRNKSADTLPKDAETGPGHTLEGPIYTRIMPEEQARIWEIASPGGLFLVFGPSGR